MKGSMVFNLDHLEKSKFIDLGYGGMVGKNKYGGAK